MNRRDFLRLSGAAGAAGLLGTQLPSAQAAATAAAGAPGAALAKPDYALRIARSLVELAPDHIVSTTTYNGQFPGPLIRLK